MKTLFKLANFIIFWQMLFNNIQKNILYKNLMKNIVAC